MFKRSKFFEKMRTRMGLTQEHFAQLLKVSRGHLSMAELGKRDLPTSSYMMLAKMDSDFNSLEIGALANYRSLETRLFLNNEYAKIIPVMQKKEKLCRQKIKLLKEELATMTQQAKDSENWIIVITRLADEIKEDSTKSKELEWMLLLKQQCYDRLLTCWEPEQTKLHMKIAALAGEARALRKYRLKIKKKLVE